MRFPFLTTALVGTLSLSAIGGELPPPVRAPLDVVRGNEAFADDLLREFRKQDKIGNLVFSPLSISTAFSMLYGGAKGQTAEEIRRTLHFPEDPRATHAAYRQLAASLNIWTKTCQLRTVNAMFPQKGHPILPGYLALLKTNYRAGAFELDFAGDAQGATKAINGWIERQTATRIRNMISPGMLGPDTRFALVNAVYFKSRWASPFSVGMTHPAAFHPLTGAAYQANMMRQTDKFPYLENSLVQVVELPYVGRRHSMVILLPKARDGLPELEKRFVDSTSGVDMAKVRWRQVALSLPRFEIDGATIDLVPTLKTLGMRRVFSALQAELEGISKERGLFLDAVLHKAWIRVDEEGTEAAAATGMGGAMGAAEETPKPIVFRADHPFLFALRDRQTGAILFLGRLARPPKA